MTITERIDQEFKEAMKAKSELALSTLRLIKSALKNEQISLGHELAEAEIVAVLKRMIRQYQDALSDFTNAGRRDLAERQQAEIDLIARYLPPSLPDEEIERLVREAIEASGATDFGKAMAAAMKAMAGRADGNQVRTIVQKILQPPLS